MISVRMLSVLLDEVFVAEEYMGKLMFSCLMSVMVYGRNIEIGINRVSVAECIYT
jgi:hypothetical protein